jgi:hypothetical protein
MRLCAERASEHKERQRGGVGQRGEKREKWEEENGVEERSGKKRTGKKDKPKMSKSAMTRDSAKTKRKKAGIESSIGCS